MKYAFCTLFDSNYLDKGIVTLKSLIGVLSDKSTIYVLAMDGVCYQVMNSMEMENIIVIHIQDFENERLLAVKQSRTKAEYCWTCTASLIKYCIDFYQEKCVTYFDADMFFYQDPSALIDKMIQNRKSVMILEHGFANGYRKKKYIASYGRFCVQFNTFLNDKKGKEVLNKWIEDTIEYCSATPENNGLGDQFYLNEWPKLFDCVYICQDRGAGVAPWNINQYALISNKEDEIRLCVDKRDFCTLIFYHFHCFYFVNDEYVNINVFQRYWKVDKKLVGVIYNNYINEILSTRKELQYKYAFTIDVHSHLAYNSVKRTIPIIIKSFMSRGALDNVMAVEDWLLRKLHRSRDLIKIISIEDRRENNHSMTDGIIT